MVLDLKSVSVIVTVNGHAFAEDIGANAINNVAGKPVTGD
jgi:hypothetical protein